MFRTLLTRFRQGHRTVRFPKAEPTLPDRFRGLPKLNMGACTGDICHACAEVCPTSAITFEGPTLQMDLGRCLFCADCAEVCPSSVIAFTPEYRLAVRKREGLVVRATPGGSEKDRTLALAEALDAKARSLFGRSLKLRQVSAGGCNACEADVNVLTTVVFDLGRFGVQFVASPRHADGLLITGPVSQNMRLALHKTYEALAEPKLVIAVGACAISGGPFVDHEEVCNGADGIVPVDLYIPGCPPHPITILDGLLRLLGRIQKTPKT